MHPVLRDAPDLYPDLIPVWNAFWSLHQYRAVNFGGIGAIPISEISSYARIFRVDDEREFFTLISEMDSVYLEFARKAAEPKKQ